MKAIEYRDVLDKSQWKRGEWDHEPDKAQWQDEATGLPCLIVRHSHSGHLCGYVGVTKGHRLFMKNDDECDVSVHGGITFTAFCNKSERECAGVCHVVEKGEDDRVWWLGFDCAHSGDYSSMAYPEHLREKYPHDEDVYRDFEYVKEQCKQLAAQLKE